MSADTMVVDVLDARGEIERHLSLGTNGRIVIRTTSENKVRLFSPGVVSVSLEIDEFDAAVLADQIRAACSAIKARPGATPC